ncbi:MAG: hypothetical protein J0L97_00460 [Alphaproteobacteria bacterium]|nr:hypothetical protein [Alphaproteobacteria bacterium]
MATRKLARRYAVSMGDMADRLRDYIRLWSSAEAIALHPRLFCDATKELLENLEIRIGREEEHLYPASDVVNL